MLFYWVARICSVLARHLPVSVSYKLVLPVADITYLVWHRGRRGLKANIAQALGSQASSAEVSRVSRRALRNFCKYAVDFLRSSLLSDENNKRVNVKDWQNLDEALEEGKGAILVGLHLGNFDLAAALVARRRYRLNAIADIVRNFKLNDFVQRLRTGVGTKIIPAGQEIGALVQALRRNEVVALLIDCPNQTSRKGVRVKFCDRLTRVPAGAATLALRTGAKVIPCSLVQLPDKTFLGLIQPYIPFQTSGNLSQDVQDLTQHIVNSLEEFVRQYPDQWYMFRHMWPEEAAPFQTPS